MLQLILGIAGTGKTTDILSQIESRAKQGKQSLLLVPEQFSSSAEILVYWALGDANSALVQVLSFRTLAERIVKAAGGANLPILTDAGRAVFVRRAMDALGDAVRTFVRQRRNTAFCAMCADAITELKTAGASPALLRKVAQSANEPKLAELALIFEAYETAIDTLALDPQDCLSLAASRLQDGFLQNTMCFIDNFDGFTAPEYTLLGQMLQCCEGVTVALCCDSLTENSGGLGLFSPVRRTAQHLLRLAAQADMRTPAPKILETLHRSKVQGLVAVNLLFAGADEPKAATNEGLTLTECANDWEEIRLAAAKMSNLAKAGVPFSRMALVCRDITKYESLVRRACALFEIPLFVDAPTTIEYTAPVVFLRASLRLLREGLSSEPILTLLKTGLCGYAEAEIAALENYVYTWAPKAADWRVPFENNPAGLMAHMDETAQQQLDRAERLRGELVPTIEEFIKRGRTKSTVQVSKELYLLLDCVEAPKHADTVVEILRARGDVELAEKSCRAWDVCMSLLDQMVALLGNETLTPAEYDEFFLLLVRATDFGQAPQVLECVTFTSADRMRLADPDYCFVLGLCEGEFPMQIGYSGLLTHADRDLLVAGGVELPGSFENRTLLEEMFLYRALTSARKGIFASWPQRQGGVLKNMASAMEPALQLLQPGRLEVPFADMAGTRAAGFELLAALYRDNNEEAATLQAALGMDAQPKTKELLALLKKVDNTGAFSVKDTAVLQELLGNELVLSATKAERYYECRFSYFMERVLGVVPRRKAEFSPLESGTFVHYILEKVLEEAGTEFSELSDEQLAALATRHADIFIEENLPAATQRGMNILARVKKATTSLLCYLRDGAKQSDFTIDALELALTTQPDGVSPLEVRTVGGQSVRVTGKIDRVDVLHQNGKTYISIIDYKTGGKKFNLEDVYCGLNMQMLIYMRTLLSNGAGRYPHAEPAAVLYLASDPAPSTGDRAGSDAPIYKMDGLLVNDEAVVGAMDRGKSGFFVPVKYNKNGTLRSSRQLASYEKIGNIQKHVEMLLSQMAEGVYGGNFDAVPLVKNAGRPCDYCPYRAACRHEDGRHEVRVTAPEKAFEAPEGEARSDAE